MLEIGLTGSGSLGVRNAEEDLKCLKPCSYGTDAAE